MPGTTPPFFLQTFHYPNGAILSGGTLTFYVAGSTSLPKQVYADVAETIALTQPLVLDASGTAPQYFLESGKYKVLIKDYTGALIHTRDYIDGDTGSGGGGADTYLVKTTSADINPTYLAEKLADSTSVTWTTVNNGGDVKATATVNASGVLDGKILADAADPTMSYLIDKLANTSTVNLSVVGHKLQADLVSDYLPLSGGIVTGPTTFNDNVTISGYTQLDHGSVTNDFNVGLTMASTFVVAEVATLDTVTVERLNFSTINLNSLLYTNAAGDVMSVPGELFTAKVDATDTIAGYLSTKIQPGNGITINVTDDLVQGQVMHISTQTPDYNGVLVLGKIANSALTTTTTPTSILTSAHGTPLGSWTIVGGTTKVGTQYRLTVKFPSTTYATYLDISLSSIVGGGVTNNITIPAGSSQIDFDVLFMDLTYGANANFQYSIISSASPYVTMSAPSGWGIFDCADDMTFDAKLHTLTTASTTSPQVNLWKM